MSEVLRVTDVRLEEQPQGVTLSGAVAGQRLFWSMPHRDAVAVRAEPFIAALLVSAMRRGAALELPSNVPGDPQFLANLAQLQEIFARWFPGLRSVEIGVPDLAQRPGTSGRLAGYSGGIDSAYTVMQLARRIDGTVLMDGIEYGTPNPDLAADVDRTLREVMQARGLPLVTVQTNVKFVGRATGGVWSQFIGGTLASVPHAIGAAEYWVAGSNAWENLRPYGTHPFTDPLWSSRDVTIRHHGAEARRIDKTAALGSATDLLDALRVCFQGTAYNCGTCHKCLQTSAALRALHLTSAAMPPLEDPRLLRRLAVEHDGDLVDWAEILTPELRRTDPALARELGRLVRRYAWRQALRRLDTVATGGLFRRLMAGPRRGAAPRPTAGDLPSPR